MSRNSEWPIGAHGSLQVNLYLVNVERTIINELACIAWVVGGIFMNLVWRCQFIDDSD